MFSRRPSDSSVFCAVEGRLVPGLLDHAAHDLCHRTARVGGLQALDDAGERQQAVDRGRRQPGHLVGLPQRLPESVSHARRMRLQALQAGGADAALGRVDDAQQALRVGGVDDDREVRDEVADLGALVELGPADDLVGDRVAPELLLEHAALGVGAVEHGDLVRPVRPLGALGLALEQLLHLAGDELRLGALVGDLHDLDERALPPRGPQVLALALAVVGDHGVGRVEDLLRGAVVLLQADDLRVRVVALELEDVADVGAAPRVDALVVVAHHGEVAVRAGEQVGEPVLGVVGVLVLVDEHEAERLLVVLQPVRIALEQLDRLHQKVVEVHGVHLGVALLVELVGVGRHLRVAPALVAELGGPHAAGSWRR